MVLSRVPLLILLLFAIDAALVAAALIDHLAGSPYPRLRNLLDLNSEFSLPAWYSSMKWFCAGVVFALLPLYTWHRRLPGLAALAGLALLFVVFSADEIVAMHEWLGRRTDVLLPGGTRAGTSLSRTGLWPMLIGIPTVALIAYMLYRIRLLFKPAPRALRLLILGLAIMFTGALVLELGMNLVATGPDEHRGLLLQAAVEEFLEMLGVSIVLWSGYELLQAYEFELRTPYGLGAPVESARRTAYGVRRGASAPGATLRSK